MSEQVNSHQPTRKDYLLLRKQEAILTLRRFLKNRSAVFGGILTLIIVTFALFAPYLTGYYPSEFIDTPLLGISSKHILGLDDLGRDFYTRIVYGIKVSVGVGIFSQLIAGIIGIIVGTLSGYYGETTDNILMRITDIFLAFPFYLIAILMLVTIGPGFRTIILTLGVSMWPTVARVVRAQVLILKKQSFIEAAHSIGCGDLRCIFFHLLPNCLSPVLVVFTIGMATAILAEAGLSFLGFGIQPPTPSLGIMMATGKSYMRDYPRMIFAPGIVTMIAVLGVNLLGDGMRDILDPRLKT